MSLSEKLIGAGLSNLPFAGLGMVIVILICALLSKVSFDIVLLVSYVDPLFGWFDNFLLQINLDGGSVTWSLEQHTQTVSQVHTYGDVMHNQYINNYQQANNSRYNSGSELYRGILIGASIGGVAGAGFIGGLRAAKKTSKLVVLAIGAGTGMEYLL